MNADIVAFLDGYSKAFNAGDVEALLDGYYALPLVMLTDSGTTVLASRREAAALLSGTMQKLRVEDGTTTNVDQLECAVIAPGRYFVHADLTRVFHDGTVAKLRYIYVLVGDADSYRIALLIESSVECTLTSFR